MIPALTIRQPHAGRIMAGIKDVENRTWWTEYRGPLAIHAGGKGGALIGLVDLVDIVTDSPSEWAISGQYHWVLANPRPFDPIPCRGRLKLWYPDPPLVVPPG